MLHKLSSLNFNAQLEVTFLNDIPSLILLTAEQLILTPITIFFSRFLSVQTVCSRCRLTNVLWGSRQKRLRTFWTGVHRPHRKRGFQGFSPPSTFYLHGWGEQWRQECVGNIISFTVTQQAMGGVRQSSWIWDHIFNMIDWRVNDWVPAESAVWHITSLTSAWLQSSFKIVL